MRRLPALSDVPAGAVGGAVATVAMTAAMAAARLAGSGGEEPPQRITAGLLDAAGIDRTRGEQRATALLFHVGFGAAGGILYRVLRRALQTPGPPVLHGAGFGLGVWAVSYAGWVPALRLLPPPRDDRPDRQARLIVAHLVYGAVLGRTAEPPHR